MTKKDHPRSLSEGAPAADRRRHAEEIPRKRDAEIFHLSFPFIGKFLFSYSSVKGWSSLILSGK